MSNFLKDLKKINPMAEVVSLSSLGTIKGYVSTGSYSLNAALTGNIYNGPPEGRVLSLVGKTSTGKSYVLANLIREAQKKGYFVTAFQSENASDKFFYQRLGCNTDEIVDMPITTIEELNIQCVQTIEAFAEERVKNPEAKLFIALDSFGNLMTNKEHEDAKKGKNAGDMGLRAKLARQLSRLITMPIALNDIIMVVLNHSYTNSSGYIPVEVPVGGEGINYISSIMATMTKEKVRDEDKILTGNILKATTTKNRLIPEGKLAKMLIDFETGVNPYYGLLDYALAADLIVKEGTTNYVKHLDKKIFEKNIYVPEVWEPILEPINEYIKSQNKYSSVSDEILTNNNEVVNENEEKTKEVKRGRKPKS
jgi:RecA/RadA recombinase